MKIKDIKAMYKDEFINNYIDSWDKCFKFKLYGNADTIKYIVDDMYEYPYRTLDSLNWQKDGVMITIVDKETNDIMVFGDDVYLDDVTELIKSYSDNVVAYGVLCTYQKAEHKYSAVQFLSTGTVNSVLTDPMYIDVEDDDIYFDIGNTSLHLYGKYKVNED